MKIVLYACTDLAYDQIFSPVVATPGVEHVLFADRRPRFVRGWQWRPKPPQVAGLGSAMANRYVKFFPHEIFPDADVSIYVDANTLILSDLRPLIAEFLDSGADLGLFIHKQRHDVFEELEFCRSVGKISAEDYATGQRQLAHYAAEGLPRVHRLTENGILLRRHGAPDLAEAMALWWRQLETFTRRDQLSLPYVLLKSGVKTKIFDWNYKFENPYFTRYLHSRGRMKNLYVLMRNKRHFGRANYYLFGAILGLYRTAFKRSAPPHTADAD